MHKATSRGNKHSQYDLQKDFANIKEALAEASDDVKGRVGEILAQSVVDVQGRSADVRDTLAVYVADKPFKSLGLAMLTGLFIGYFLRR